MAKAFNVAVRRMTHRVWLRPVGSKDRVSRYRHVTAARSSESDASGRDDSRSPVRRTPRCPSTSSSPCSGSNCSPKRRRASRGRSGTSRIGDPGCPLKRSDEDSPGAAHARCRAPAARFASRPVPGPVGCRPWLPADRNAHDQETPWTDVRRPGSCATDGRPVPASWLPRAPRPGPRSLRWTAATTGSMRLSRRGGSARGSCCWARASSGT